MYEITVTALTIFGFGSWGTYFWLRKELFDPKHDQPYRYNRRIR